MARRRLLLLPGAAVALGMLIAALAVGVAAGGMGCHSGIERDAAETQVVLTGSCMDPLIARVPEGGIVTFTNGDQITHSITGAANAWGTYDDLIAGTSVAYRFSRAGVFPYFCYIHPGMIGAIVVGDGAAGGGGDSVRRVSLTRPSNVATTPAPTARPTPLPTAEPTASAAAAAPVVASPPDDGDASLVGPTSVLMIGLLATLLGGALAYGVGLIPGRRAGRPHLR